MFLKRGKLTSDSKIHLAMKKHNIITCRVGKEQLVLEMRMLEEIYVLVKVSFDCSSAGQTVLQDLQVKEV